MATDSTTAISGTTAWHALSPDDALDRLDVDADVGLTTAEIVRRQTKYGLNELDEVEHESRLAAFIRQYRNLLQIVLLVASVVAFAIGEISTGAVVFAITLFNAILALNQESRAEKGLAGLRDMLHPEATVRRDGDEATVGAEQLVPGDIVSITHGDRVPADGRLLSMASLETDEASLTGESTPVLKRLEAVAPETALADRTDLVFANTTTTRGSATFVVTATGMSTEVGNVAGMLQETKTQTTPLTRQIDSLTRLILGLAAIAFVAIVFILRVREGDSWSDLFNVGVALAIGAIPDALPAVVTAVLALGTVHMSQRDAIVKTLPSAEALGSTSAICTDKTGTLTVGQMTVRELALADGGRYTVTGEGYTTTGTIRHVGAHSEPLDPYLLPMALCSDAVVDDGELIGDPNEGALVTLAEKGGIDVDATRQAHPRLATVPFDSAYMLMGTFHDAPGGPSGLVRGYVKGAPDVLLERSSNMRTSDGSAAELTDDDRQRLRKVLADMGGRGLRVMAVAVRDIARDHFDPDADHLDDINDLTFLALTGIVDPPRPEVKSAIEKCKGAGIRVRMITGDQLVTAQATAQELGIEGEAMTGHDFSALSDDDLAARLDGLGVVARVAPEDKVRLVDALQRQNNIVAMTGDGVNDAPALKRADIGVAMGTGTDVAKDAGKMILVDDDFATIVAAVEEGRGIYDNLMKYIRVQMANLIGFVVGFLLAAAIAGTALFEPSQVLLVHFVVVASVGAALGFDTPAPDLMQRAPRDADAPVISLRLGARIVVAGALMAAFTVAVRQWGEAQYDSAAIGESMAFVTFAYAHIALALNLRFENLTMFQRSTLSNRNLWLAFALVLLVPILVTEFGVLRDVFETVPLTANQWAIGAAAALVLLVIGELAKLGERVGIIPRT
ncbi:MAG: HAD-IC family P-type ATPase [Actinomycetota bacterium]